MTHKCKIFEAFDLTLHWHWYFVYTHVCQGKIFMPSSKNFIYIYKKISMTTKGIIDVNEQI